MAKKQPKPPTCAHCGAPAQLVGGVDVYPRRQDLVERKFWRCSPCAAWCGCHGNTTRPLGRPGNRELREARMVLHQRMVDPLWQHAIGAAGYHPEDARAAAIITNTARSRVYFYLSWKLGLDRDDCHVAMFTLEQCRAAWVALRGVTYQEIRAWAKARKDAAERATA